MSIQNAQLEPFTHSHVFGLDQPRPGERRTILVTMITLAAMAIEVMAGYLFGSMALLADGLHMGSHAIALGISAFAYAYSRRHAGDSAFTFGTGKVDALAGFAGAVLLASFAGVIAVESVSRIAQPRSIDFDMAVLVAGVGLIVNVVCAFILGGHAHGHSHTHQHDHSPSAHTGRDHTLNSAYLHVLADALTSVLAIVSLLVAKYTGQHWVDPLVGIIGAVMIARWSVGLLRATSSILLDRSAGEPILGALREAITRNEIDRLADLHVWAIGPEIHGAAISIISSAPLSPDEYRARIPTHLGIVHATIEVHRL